MPDWRAIVEQHLAAQGLRRCRMQIVDELAAHLEDEFELLRGRMPDEEAQRQALRLLDKPGILAREIHRLQMEDEMTQSTRAVWVPALTMMVVYWLTAIGLGVLIVRGLRVTQAAVWAGGLVMLLLFGGIGAAWARAQGATRMQRGLVSAFPVLMPVAWVFVVGPIYALLNGRPIFFPFSGEVLNGLAKGVVIPAIGLLLGALPFLRNGGATRSQVAS